MRSLHEDISGIIIQTNLFHFTFFNFYVKFTENSKVVKLQGVYVKTSTQGLKVIFNIAFLSIVRTG